MPGTIDIILNSLTPITSAANLEIAIKSQVLPTLNLNVTSLIEFKKPAPNAESALARQLLLLAKPEIKISGVGLGSSSPITPWGRPTKNYVPAVIAVAALAILLNVYIGYEIGKASCRH